MLKSLFVPEDDYFTNKIDSLKTSLNDRIPYQQYLDDMDSLKNANNTRNNNDILDIDILISYGEYPVNEVHRISLVEENGSYKIDNLN